MAAAFLPGCMVNGMSVPMMVRMIWQYSIGGETIFTIPVHPPNGCNRAHFCYLANWPVAIGHGQQLASWPISQ